MAEKLSDEWKENCGKNIDWEVVRAVRRAYNGKYKEPTQQDLAERFDISQPMVSHIINNKHWKEDEHAPEE